MTDSQLTISNLRQHSVRFRQADDSTIYLESGYELDEYPANTGVWLHHWAEQTPDTVFLAERNNQGWREVSYAETLKQVKGLASGMLEQGIEPGQIILILSGNSIDHGLLSLAAQYVGLVTVPLAEQYSLIPEAHDRLRYIADKVSPSLVYVADSYQFESALALDCLKNVPVLTSKNHTDGQLSFALLSQTPVSETLDASHEQVCPDTTAKILFTSGSTSLPKGVITTQRMLCVNQVQLAQSLPFLTERAPKILDWLPWNHVFGGSHNFNMMLANGGSLYIDNGRPVAGAFQHTVENLRQHAGTLSFNVPLGFSLLVAAMEQDPTLKQAYFENLDMIFYAGASLPQPVWDKLEQFALEVRGKLPLLISCWGMTETAPATLIVHQQCRRSGVIGVPMPGVTVKMLANDVDRYELRVKGPNITPGYYRDPSRTSESLDEDGFLITGDAVRFADPENKSLGLAFDGRISEDFKLQSGTWVRASVLRLEALKILGSVAQDIVICGQDRMEIGILVFPAANSTASAIEIDGAMTGESLQQSIQTCLSRMAEHSTGSSTRICRALVLSTPPSLQEHEITVKGNLNVQRVLDNRSDLVERLYDDQDPAIILLPKS